MDNHEEILDALTAFGKNPNPQEIPSVLEQYLNSVAKNGETLFPWSQLKPLILRKMELVIMELRRNLASENIPTRPNVENVRFDVIHARIIDSLHKFNGAPFTIQRLCELLIDPKRHYKRSDKFMRGLEKNVLVVSTVDPFGRKVVSELGNKPVLNGILDINGSYPPRDTALSVPLPPVPGWVNTTAANRSAAAEVSSMPLSAGVEVGNKMMAGNNLDTLGKDSDGMVSNSLAVSGTQVFSDQGPLTVQSEEVVEETVVTMDTGEVSSVVTDGGEALADREMDERDDRDASSFSSSSSSSSEELSTSSDSIENALRCSSSPLQLADDNLTEEITAMDENRPWAAFAQDSKQVQDDLGTTTTSLSSSSSNQPVIEENQTSGVSSSSPQHMSSTDTSSSISFPLSSSSPPSSKAQSSLLSASTTVTASKVEDDQQKEGETSAAACGQQTTVSSVQSKLQQSPSCDQSSSTADNINQSFGFDPADTSTTATTTSLQSTDDMTSATMIPTEKLISSSTSKFIPTTNNNINNTLSSDIHSSSSLADNVIVPPQPPTYAQVVASSTTDKILLSSPSPSSIQNISPFDSTTEPVPACDSVAGLERLVGSMEQSMSSSSSLSSSTVCPSSSSSFQLSSSLPSSSHSSVTASHSSSSLAVTTSSLPESSLAPVDPNCHSSSQCCSSEEGEPASKRLRLSVDEESMDEDNISTSGNSCMEVGQHTIEEEKTNLEQHEDEGSGTVHSSCVEEQFQGQTEGDIQMKDEEGITTGAAPSGVVGIDNNENGDGVLESTSGDGDNTIDGVMSKPVAGCTEGNGDFSNTESSDVSTTDRDDNNTTQQVVDAIE